MRKKNDIIVNHGVNVPFFDLKRQIHDLRKELESLFAEVLADGAFILGRRVEYFEQQVADFVGVNNAVGVASGTDALMLSYQALGVGRGEGLITTPLTFFATVGAMLRLGAKPFFVDVDPLDFNIDPFSLKEFLDKECRYSGNVCIHRKTETIIKGIVPVHLFGQMAQMGTIIELAQAYGLFVVEDAAQALGAWQKIDGKRRKAGSIGNTAAFSFYPTKNLGAFGDAGMVTTNDATPADRIRMLRNHGQDADGLVREPGSCSRLDSIQAAILSLKFKFLDKWNQRRSEIAKIYRDVLSSKSWAERIRCPVVTSGNGHIWHQFVVRVPYRDELVLHLQKSGIGSNVYYRTPIHLQPVCASFGYSAGDLPKAEKACQEVLALPIWPEISDEGIYSIVKAMEIYYTSVRR